MIQWSALKMILPVGMDWSGQKNSTLPGQTLVVLSTHSACLVVISTRRCVPSSQLWTSKIILKQIALIVLNIVPISILPKEHPQFLDDKQIQSCNLGSWKTENFITFKWTWDFRQWCNRCTWSSQPPQVPKGFADSTPAVHVCASEALAKAKVMPNKIHFILKVIENGILQNAGKWGMGMKFWLCHLWGLLVISCHKFMAQKKIA